MAVQDQAAAQKAAGDFQAMLQQMVKVQEEALRQAEVSGQQAGESEKEAKDMIDAMKALVESSGKIASASSQEDFVAGLDMLKAPGSPMEPFMAMILQTLASKTVMYPPLKEIHDNYPAFFKEHGASLDNDTRKRYEKQYEVLGKICHEFENQPDEPANAAQATNGGLPNFNSEPADISNFENLGKLLVELQTYGYPPKELTGELPAGWSVDESTGLPKVEDISTAANSCAIM
ncbi:Pex19 family protein [Necator americanus]|uniref:Peroxin-19 n=1 Tax=Necator americanus TaxID=51031 RepID=W2TUT6_NECAM|nr:Pex19 family protein [Necator americanus]ETN84826.1 Pex19 family protein [Necator americanus]